MSLTKKTRIEPEAWRVEDFFENWDFWTGIVQEPLMQRLISVATELDKLDSECFSVNGFRNLEILSGDLRINIAEFLASLTDRFRWMELIYPEPLLFDREPAKFRTPELPFFLGSSAIVRAKKSDKFVLVIHSHAAAAFHDDKLIAAAKQFLKDSLEPLMSYYDDENIHGVLMIGGKATIYEMDDDEEELIPFAGKLGTEWLSVADKEVLSAILGIVMRAWRTLDPRGMKTGIRQTMKGTRCTIVRNGFTYDSESDDSDHRSDSD